MTLPRGAEALLERARTSDHAVEVYHGYPSRTLAVDLVALLGEVNAASLGERALWNLLFTAGELSLSTDVYRAHELFLAVTSLLRRVAALPYVAGDPRASAAEMTYDFFFARPAHPLLTMRGDEVVGVLEALLHEPRLAVRAALHGLGHVVTSANDAVAARARAALAAYEGPDEGLRALRDEAHAGALA